MLESIKNEIFERLGKECYELSKSARYCRQHGEEKLAEQTHWQILGVHQAVEALGFDLEEFAKYYRENRRRYRKERIEA
ncbi:hypothetical protein [Bacillus andreraoultii]|uniref:hypothetical protein n=1 Tax=Bacillus andreraoultii TaxID=1499685 RepID=UPI0005398FD6|nr:hypothetical protein [Bacillus andreraoultii]